MSIVAEFKAKKSNYFSLKPIMTFDDLLLENVGYGVFDDYYRLDENKIGESTFVLFDNYSIGRGVNVEYKGDFSKFTAYVNFPATTADIDLLFALIELAIKKFDYEVKVDEREVSEEDIKPMFKDSVSFNESFLSMVKEKVEDDKPLTIFGVHHPMLLSKQDFELLNCQDEFDRFIYEKQKVDAYYAVSKLYKDQYGSIIGNYVISEGCLSIVPDSPRLPLGVKLQGQIDEDDISYSVALFSIQKKKVVKEMSYGEFLETFENELSYYDGGHLLLEALNFDCYE